MRLDPAHIGMKPPTHKQNAAKSMEKSVIGTPALA
jgi:hypothetical protein